MPSDNRTIEWRQGDVFSRLDEHSEEIVGIVISHDCDICASDEQEPSIEWIDVTFLQKVDGSRTFGKNPRILHLEATSGDAPLSIEVSIQTRKLLDKQIFFSSAARHASKLGQNEVRVLRRWLAARYSRSAFPNSFELALSKTKVVAKLDQLAKQKGAGIRALYFDLDDNELVERAPTDDPYDLRIYVVYPPSTADDEGEKFSIAVHDVFKKAFLNEQTQSWELVRLTSCDAVSENEFPFALSLSTKPWRLDYRSLAGESLAAYLPEPNP